MCILQFLHILFSRRARVPQWGTASPSSLDDLITTWLQQNSYSFFLSRTYLWQARQCFPCRWDRQNKDWEVSFFRQHFPSKAHRPTTNEHHETTNRRLQSSTFCVVARKLHTWSCMEVLLTSRCHPKNLLLFWRRCVLPYDLNIPLKNSFRINRRVARAQEMWTEERYLVGPICWNGVDKENIARMECFCSTIICHCC